MTKRTSVNNSPKLFLSVFSVFISSLVLSASAQDQNGPAYREPSRAEIRRLCTNAETFGYLREDERAYCAVLTLPGRGAHPQLGLTPSEAEARRQELLRNPPQYAEPRIDDGFLKRLKSIDLEISKDFKGN